MQRQHSHACKTFARHLIRVYYPGNLEIPAAQHNFLSRLAWCLSRSGYSRCKLLFVSVAKKLFRCSSARCPNSHPDNFSVARNVFATSLRARFSQCAHTTHVSRQLYYNKTFCFCLGVQSARAAKSAAGR